MKSGLNLDNHKFCEDCGAKYNLIASSKIPKKCLGMACSAQTRTGIGLLGKPPAMKQFLAVESHLDIRASYATRRKRRYEANKCGWTQPLFRKARDRGIY